MKANGAGHALGENGCAVIGEVDEVGKVAGTRGNGAGGVGNGKATGGADAADLLVEAILHVEEAVFAEHGVELSPGDQHGPFFRGDPAAEAVGVGDENDRHMMGGIEVQQFVQIAGE